MKKRLRILIPVAVVAAALAVWAVVFKSDDPDGPLRLSGNIDVTQVDLAFQVAGRLADRRVDEGQRVTRGQRLAALDDTDLRLGLQKADADRTYAAAVLAELAAGSRPEEIARARARVQQARFALADLQSGSRAQEIEEARAEQERALADERAAASQLALAQSEFARFEALFARGSVSRQTYDTYQERLTAARNAADAAAARRQAAEQRLSLRQAGSRQGQIRQARAALAQAEADYALVEAGPRQESVDQARARQAAAEAAWQIARRQLAQSELFAPFDGVVLSTSAEPGAYLTPGATVLTVGRLDDVWLRAFVSESDLGRVRLEQPAAVSVDAYPERRWAGRVTFIASEAEFTPRSVQTFKERTNLVYRVKISLHNPDGVLKAGMPADAVFEAAR